MDEELEADKDTPGEKETEDGQKAANEKGRAESEEKRAKLQGWVAQDDYYGDPDNWRSASEFLEVGEKHAAVQKERNEKLAADVEASRRDNLTMKAQMETLIKHQAEQKRRGIQNEIRRLNSEKRQAVEEADLDVVDVIEKEIEALRKEDVEEKTPSGPSPAFIDWQSHNEWYNVDVGMSVAADELGAAFQNSGRFTSEHDLFKALDKEMSRRYPAELGKKEKPGEKPDEKPDDTNPNKRRRAAVAGSRRKVSDTDGKSFDDVPSEDKKMFYMQQEIMGKKNYTEAHFMAEYEFE